MKHTRLSLKAVVLSAMMLLSSMAFAQITATGTIVDAANGEPVIGASILEMGTTNGTITDFDGNFTIKVASGATLSISYMGYKTLELAAQPVMKITLAEDAELLDEVVVVGYGVVKKNDATGSVTAIKPDDMNKGLTTSAQDLLAGKIAGVSVTNGGGTPGGAATIRIRGGSSLNASNDPLIVIDGLAMDNDGIPGASNGLAMVNPSEIESFTVLKDASATAIYGSRASNGVIIITTKKGAKGTKPQFSYQGNVSVGILTNRLETLTGDEIRAYAEALGHKDKKTKYLGTANTDWQKEIYRPAPQTDHIFTVTGGTKHMPYRASLGYTYQDGIIKTSYMHRLTGGLNLSPSFFDNHLNFNINLKGVYTNNRYADGVSGAALSMDPTMPVKGAGLCKDGTNRPTQEDADNYFGGYYQVPSTANYNDSEWLVCPSSQSTQNPVATLDLKKNIANSGAFVGNVEADYKVHGFEALRLHANFGADYSRGCQTQDISPYSASNHYYGYKSEDNKYKYNLQFNCYAQYYEDWENVGQHFDAMIGYEWQHFKNWGTYAGGGMYQATNKDATLAGTPHDYSETTWGSENYLVSFFGRINWIGWNQVLLTATVRADGSSRFAKDKRWGVFPSVALGWKINETFFRDNATVSDLKLRLGYGITGQQDIGEDYMYLAQYAMSQEGAYYPIGGAGYEAYTADNVQIVDADGNVLYKTYRPGAYNPELTWEKTTTYNAGVDFGFLRQRVTGNVDFYYRNTTDLIQTVAVPAGTNFRNSVTSNVGSLRNMGVEFALNAVAIDRKNFKWDLGFNFTWNDNKITHLQNLAGEENPDYFISTGGISSGRGNTIQVHKVGYSANTFRVFETERFDDGAGHVTYAFVDRNKDGKLTEDDQYYFHSAAAPFMMGFQTKFQFYGFDLGITLRASIGNYVYNDVLASNLQWVESGKVCNAGYHGLLRNAYDTYWTKGFMSDGIYALLYNESAGSYEWGSKYSDWFRSDFFVENASFLRCDNITLGYTFEKNAKNPNLNARLYVTVSNPFVITGYSGLDPEVFGGVDGGIYPRSMSTMVGVNLNF